MTGLDLITRERERQIINHHFTAENDDKYIKQELVRAAMHYAAPSAHVQRFWPTNWSRRWDQKKDDDRITQLAKAGALIAAEIDRLLRAANVETESWL